MNAQKPDAKPLELSLVDMDPPAAADPAHKSAAGPSTPPGKELRITNADAFLEEAAREYQSGKVDHALWARTKATSDDDEIAVAAYLRSRATALQLEERNARAAKGEGPPSGMRGTPTGTRGSRSEGPSTRSRGTPSAMRGTPTGPRGSKAEGPPTGTRGGSRPAPAPRAGRLGVPRNVMYMGAAAAGVSFIAVLLWVLSAPQKTEAARQAVSAAVKGDAPARVASAAPTPAPAAPNAGIDVSIVDKVQEMKRVRNWNVMVLYAAEWTRKEPTNPAAWRDLSLGYANLRQLDDAREAATRAVALAPTDPDGWRGLGRVNLALERWPEAGIAFDKVLAARADDVDALCGASVAARRDGRFKDADAIAKRMGSDASCQGMGEYESVAVTARGAPARR